MTTVRDGTIGVGLLPPGPAAVARRVVDMFEVRAMGVEESVVDYIVREVLAPEPEWKAGAEQGRFTEEQVREILFDALAESQRLAVERGLGVVDLESARRAFPMVVDGRFHCPFPFMIC